MSILPFFLSPTPYTWELQCFLNQGPLILTIYMSTSPVVVVKASLNFLRQLHKHECLLFLLMWTIKLEVKVNLRWVLCKGESHKKLNYNLSHCWSAGFFIYAVIHLKPKAVSPLGWFVLAGWDWAWVLTLCRTKGKFKLWALTVFPSFVSFSCLGFNLLKVSTYSWIYNYLF